MSKKLAPVKIEKVGRVSAQSVFKGTGKNWDQWVKILDGVSARSWTHKELVAFVAKKYKLSPWWQQGVASGYEMILGRKVENRNDKGEYSLTATKSMSCDRKTLWKLISSAEGIAIWLRPLSPLSLKKGESFEAEGGVFGEIRTLKVGERLRLRWQDTDWEKPSVLQIYCVQQKNGKSILVFSQEKLKDGRTNLQMREHWRKVLNELAAMTKA